MERLSSSRNSRVGRTSHQRQKKNVLREDSKVEKKCKKKIIKAGKWLGWHPGPWDATRKEKFRNLV